MLGRDGVLTAARRGTHVVLRPWCAPGPGRGAAAGVALALRRRGWPAAHGAVEPAARRRSQEPRVPEGEHASVAGEPVAGAAVLLGDDVDDAAGEAGAAEVAVVGASPNASTTPEVVTVQ